MLRSDDPMISEERRLNEMRKFEMYRDVSRGRSGELAVIRSSNRGAKFCACKEDPSSTNGSVYQATTNVELPRRAIFGSMLVSSRYNRRKICWVNLIAKTRFFFFQAFVFYFFLSLFFLIVSWFFSQI